MSWKEFKNALSLPIACLKQCNILNLDFQAHHGLVPSTFPTLLLSAPHTPHSSCSRLISLFGRPILWFAHLSITCEAKSDLAYKLWTRVNCKDGFFLYWVKIHFPKIIFTCWSWFSAFGIYDLYLKAFSQDNTTDVSIFIFSKFSLCKWSLSNSFSHFPGWTLFQDHLPS